jgi:hypothetical protein
MHIYGPGDRPDVEVQADGTWWSGELRGWWDRDGVRLMNVQWHTGTGETHLDTVPADRVRRVDLEADPTPASR